MADVSLLIRSFETDDVQLFRNVVGEGDFIYEDIDGHVVTTLHTAVKYRAVEITKHLLSRGADVNIMNDVTGDTPLHVIFQREGHVFNHEGQGCCRPDAEESIFRMLLGSNPDLGLLNASGDPPITLASRQGSVSHVIALLEANSSQTEFRSGRGFTPLHESIANGRTDLVATLLEFGANMCSRCLCEAEEGVRELTPSDMTYKHCSRDIYNLLRSHGDTCKLTRVVPDIHWAVFQGDLDTLGSLVSQDCDMHCTDEYGRTPLQIAIAVGDKAMVELLLDHVTPPNGILVLACKMGNAEIIGCLLRKGLYTETDMSEAVAAILTSGQTDALGVLVKTTPSVLTDANVDFALEMVCSKQDVGLARMILQHCRPGELVVDMTTLSNCLCVACEQNNLDLVRCLVQYGASVNLRNTRHRLPLHCAMMNGHLETVKELVNLGANGASPLGPGYRFGKTAVYILAERGDFDMASEMIKAGASVNIPSDTRLGTPLNIAVHNTDIKMAELVINSGAILNARSSRRGWSPVNSLLQSWTTRDSVSRPSDYLAMFQFLADCGVSLKDLASDDLITKLYQTDRTSCIRLHQVACGRLDHVNQRLLQTIVTKNDVRAIALLASIGYKLNQVARMDLHDVIDNSVTLKSMCRVTIRRYLSMLHGGINTKDLPLPKTLIAYLNVEY